MICVTLLDNKDNLSKKVIHKIYISVCTQLQSTYKIIYYVHNVIVLTETYIKYIHNTQPYSMYKNIIYIYDVQKCTNTYIMYTTL